MFDWLKRRLEYDEWLLQALGEDADAVDAVVKYVTRTSMYGEEYMRRRILRMIVLGDTAWKTWGFTLCDARTQIHGDTYQCNQFRGHPDGHSYTLVD